MLHYAVQIRERDGRLRYLSRDSDNYEDNLGRSVLFETRAAAVKRAAAYLETSSPLLTSREWLRVARVTVTAAGGERLTDLDIEVVR